MIIRYLLRNIYLHINSINYWRRNGTKIGENCDIHSSASLGTEPYLIEIGSNVRINAGVQILTHDGGVWVLRNLKEEYYDCDLFRKVSIGNNVHIGTNATILPGVNIGDNCIIGLGAIVTKDIPNNSIAIGVPAKVIETIYDYELKRKDEFLHTKYLKPKEKEKYIKNICR